MADLSDPVGVQKMQREKTGCKHITRAQITLNSRRSLPQQAASGYLGCRWWDSGRPL